MSNSKALRIILHWLSRCSIIFVLSESRTMFRAPSNARQLLIPLSSLPLLLQMSLHRALSQASHQHLLGINGFVLTRNNGVYFEVSLHFHSTIYWLLDLIKGAVVGPKPYVHTDRCYSGVSTVSSSSECQAEGSLHLGLLLADFRLLGGTADLRTFLFSFHVFLRSRVPKKERSLESVPLCHATTA